MPSSNSPISLTVVSDSMVFPDQASTLGDLKLSVSDLPMLSCHYIQKGGLFTKPSFPIESLVSVLKTGLSHTLSRFPPLAGRLTTDSDGYIYITCNDAGVEFIHATATDVSVRDILSPTHVPESVKEFFAFDRTVSYTGHHNPILAVQVTELSDGVSIGCAVNAVIDGTSFWNFYNNFAEVCRGALNNSGLSLATIEPLNGSNFKKWKETIELYLGLQGIDWCLTELEPMIDDFSTDQDMARQREWVRANRMTRLILKTTMTDVVRGSIAEKDTASEFMNAIAQKYKENEKAEISQLLDKLIGMKFNPSESVREHIMRMIEITTRLSDLNMPFPADFVVHQALRTLPASFNQLKTTYFAQKDKWDLNELIAICVQEEERMKRDGELVVNLIAKPKLKPGKGKNVSSGSVGSGEGTSGTKPIVLGPKKPGNKKFKRSASFKCFFCKREGHIKKNCQGFKDWLAKKGLFKQEGTKEK